MLIQNCTTSHVVNLALKCVNGYCFRPSLTNFNKKNTHACQTSTIETDKRGKIKDFFIYTSPIFILLNERSLGTNVFYYYRIIKQEMVETETSEQSIILNPPSNLKFRT